jgi:hypothetical protein
LGPGFFVFLLPRWLGQKFPAGLKFNGRKSMRGESAMTDKRCSKCRMLFPEEELLIREDTGQPVCPDCSGLLEGEDLSCTYVEEG